MKNNIIVFGTPTCPWCKKTKDYLTSIGFKFKYIDVSSNSKALQDMERKSGHTGVPQLWINNKVVVGFDREKIDRLLNIKNKENNHESNA